MNNVTLVTFCLQIGWPNALQMLLSHPCSVTLKKRHSSRCEIRHFGFSASTTYSAIALRLSNPMTGLCQKMAVHLISRVRLLNYPLYLWSQDCVSSIGGTNEKFNLISFWFAAHRPLVCSFSLNNVRDTWHLQNIVYINQLVSKYVNDGFIHKSLMVIIEFHIIYTIRSLTGASTV